MRDDPNLCPQTIARFLPRSGFVQHRIVPPIASENVTNCVGGPVLITLESMLPCVTYCVDLPRLIIVVCAPLFLAYFSELGRTPVRLSKRPNRDKLTLWFSNNEYARQFE